MIVQSMKINPGESFSLQKILENNDPNFIEILKEKLGQQEFQTLMYLRDQYQK